MKRTHERHEFPSRPLKSRKKVQISMRPGALPVSKLSLLGDMQKQNLLETTWKINGWVPEEGGTE